MRSLEHGQVVTRVIKGEIRIFPFEIVLSAVFRRQIQQRQSVIGAVIRQVRYFISVMLFVIVALEFREERTDGLMTPP